MKIRVFHLLMKNSEGREYTPKLFSEDQSYQSDDMTDK